ncbi:hypothetical protein ACNKHM_00805 [Shigella sonnei]
MTVYGLLVNGNWHVVGEDKSPLIRVPNSVPLLWRGESTALSSGKHTVPSTQVADVRIEYVGNGQITKRKYGQVATCLPRHLSPDCS